MDSCSVACEDALTIVSELLDFEKLAAGRLTYSYFHLFLLWKQGRVYVYANDSISNLLSIYKSSHSMHPPTSHHITSHHTTLRRTTSSHHTIRHHNTLHSTTQTILTNDPYKSSSSAGMFTLEKVPTRLVSWVAQSVQIFRVSAESKGDHRNHTHTIHDRTNHTVAIPIQMLTILILFVSRFDPFLRTENRIHPSGQRQCRRAQIAGRY